MQGIEHPRPYITLISFIILYRSPISNKKFVPNSDYFTIILKKTLPINFRLNYKKRRQISLPPYRFYMILKWMPPHLQASLMLPMPHLEAYRSRLSSSQSLLRHRHDSASHSLMLPHNLCHPDLG